MRKISREFARVSIICFILSLVMLVLFFVVKNLVFIGVSIALMYVAILIKMQLIKCPYCGYKVIMPSWAKVTSVKCKNCSESFSYDK